MAYWDERYKKARRYASDMPETEGKVELCKPRHTWLRNYMSFNRQHVFISMFMLSQTLRNYEWLLPYRSFRSAFRTVMRPLENTRGRPGIKILVIGCGTSS